MYIVMMMRRDAVIGDSNTKQLHQTVTPLIIVTSLWYERLVKFACSQNYYNFSKFVHFVTITCMEF